MEIELKRIAYNPRLNENIFAGNLVIDGQKAGTVSNKNGQTEYYATDENGIELIAKAEEYLKKQPGEKKMIEGKEQVVKQTLAGFINNLFTDYLAVIEQKKFSRKVDLIQKRNIVIGEPGRYMRTYPLGALASIILAQRNGSDNIKNILVMKVMPTLSEKEQILNTNLPVAILIEAGLQPGQYIASDQDQMHKKTIKKNPGLKP